MPRRGPGRAVARKFRARRYPGIGKALIVDPGAIWRVFISIPLIVDRILRASLVLRIAARKGGGSH